MTGARLLVFLLLAFAALVQPATAGEKRALLIGVSGYRHLPEQYHLYGPKNDVVVMKNALQARGFKAEDITILADQVADSAGDPTEANIRAHLAALAKEERKPDDVLVIYLSGHGTSVRDQPGGDELDGYDEVFLPIDFKPVEGAENGVTEPATNYLRDDDLGEAVAAIVARGGETVFILDSCFSGTGLRGNARPKFVATKLINGDEMAPTGLGRGEKASALDDLPSLPGKLVAFFASSDEQVSKEIPTVRLSPKKDHWISAFTRALDEVLKSPEPMSYDALFQNAVRILKTDPVFGSLQNPDRFGNGFDRPVFGDTELRARPRNWSVDKGRILAGRIDGLTQDSVVALYDRAEADDKDAIGYAQVVEIGAVSGELEPVEYPCKRKPRPVCVPLGDRTLVQKPLFARPAMLFIDRKLAISAPMALPGLADEAAVKDQLVLAQKLAGLIGDDEIVLAQPGEGADFMWYVSGSEFRFQLATLADGNIMFGPSVPLDQLKDRPPEAMLPVLRAALKRGKVIKRLIDLKDDLPSTRRNNALIAMSSEIDTARCAAEAARTGPAQDVCGKAVIHDIVNKGWMSFRPFVFALDGDWRLYSVNPESCDLLGGRTGEVKRGQVLKLDLALNYRTQMIRDLKAAHPEMDKVRHGFILIAIPEANPTGNPCSLHTALETGKGTGDDEANALGDLVAGDEADAGKGNDIEDRLVIQLLSWDVPLK